MAIFTVDQFKRIAQSRSGSRGIKSIVNEARMFTKTGSKTSVFLSHSHADKELVEETVAFMRTLDASVYVDWMDESMSSKPNGTTGQKVKEKINSNDKFVFIATNNAVSSKWCNWEVGIGDVLKLLYDKICILPLADNQGHWLGNEYLQVYPRVERVESHDNIYRLIYPNKDQVWFDDWLKK